MYFTKRLALLALMLSVVAVGPGALHAQPAQTVARAAKTTATAQRASKTSAKAASKTSPRPVVSSSGSAANIVMTPEVFEQRSAALADKLLYDCLRPRCAGDVPYSNCFNKDEEVDSILRNDQACTALLNKEGQEVRDEARRRVFENLEKRYEDACNAAGGQFKSVERTCQVKITFAANRQDGKVLIAKGEHWRAFDIGRSMTCSTSTFSIQDNDMFYRPEKTIEQEISTINAVVGLGTNVLSGAMSGFAWHKADKALKTGDKNAEDTIFQFTGSRLTPLKMCRKWDFKEKVKDCTGDGWNKDSQGNCYSTGEEDRACTPLGEASSTGSKYGASAGWWQNGQLVNLSSATADKNTIPSCGSITAEGWNKGTYKDSGCWVRIKFATATTIATEQNSLIRSFGIMEASKAKDAQRERMNQIRQQIMMAQMMQQVQTGLTGSEKVSMISTAFNEDDVRALQQQHKNVRCQPSSHNRSGQTFPMDCSWNENGTNVSADFFEVRQIQPFTCKEMNAKGVEEISNCSEFDYRMLALFALMDKKDSNIGTYAAALNAYQDAQNTINREAERVKGLQQDVEDAKKGVQDAGTAVLGNVMEMWVTDMTYQATRELGNGQCYIWANDSKTWYPFIKEGQSRRIGWSNF